MLQGLKQDRTNKKHIDTAACFTNKWVKLFVESFVPKTIADIRWIAGWLETRSQFKSDSDPLSPMSRYPRGSAELFFSLFSSLFPIAICYFRSLDWGSHNPLHLNMYRESRKLDSTILSVQCTYFTILWKWKHTRWAMKWLVYIRHTIANRG